MVDWLDAALNYVPHWVEYQRQHLAQPGCVVAIAHQDGLVFERAFGYANCATGESLTPRHRFRVASHSKAFTAAGILKLKERGLLRLDDMAGDFVSGLHENAATATVQQLLSHSAGLVRDGRDSGYFVNERPFLTAAELLDDLAQAPPLPAAERFKYSNYGYGLLGLIIEAVTGEAFTPWIMREIVTPAGLAETDADAEQTMNGRLASGHSCVLPLGRRLVLPSNQTTNAMAPAAGFVSTASDLASFFAQISPKSQSSLLSPGSRRDMVRRHWRDIDTTAEFYYGLGTISGNFKDWEWFGHLGTFPGTLSRTAVFPSQDLVISVLTNSIDAPAIFWLDGIASILKTLRSGGAPTEQTASWAGRWWTLFGATDLVPVGDKVLWAPPVQCPPFTEVSELTITGPDTGRIARASGFSSVGEPVRRVRGPSDEVSEIWFGGRRLIPEGKLVDEMTTKYDAGTSSPR